MSTWKEWKNVIGTLCDSHPKVNGRVITEASLTDYEDTFTWNLYDTHAKGNGKILFRKWIKNGNNQNNIIMTICHQWLKKPQ